MAATAQDLTLERLEAALGGERLFGTEVQAYEVAVSTESLALAWARQHDAPEGALVVADAELSARGRRGASWVSVPGRSLAFSVVVRPGLPAAGEGLLWLLSSLVTAEGLEQLTGLDARLKWPNDVLVDGRGVAAVRVDAHLGPGQVETAVLTVRVNVDLSEDELSRAPGRPVTSLAVEGASQPRVAVLTAILDRLEVRYGESVSDLLDAYRARCDTLNRRIRAELMPSGEAAGLAADVDETGALIVESGTRRSVVGVDALKRLEDPSLG